MGPEFNGIHMKKQTLNECRLSNASNDNFHGNSKCITHVHMATCITQKDSSTHTALHNTALPEHISSEYIMEFYASHCHANKTNLDGEIKQKNHFYPSFLASSVLRLIWSSHVLHVSNYVNNYIITYMEKLNKKNIFIPAS